MIAPARRTGRNVDIAKTVPKELIEGFLNQSKNPISAIMEYGAIAKLVVSFEEAAVEVSVMMQFKI